MTESRRACRSDSAPVRPKKSMTTHFLQAAYDRLAVFDGALSPREEISFADWLLKNIRLISSQVGSGRRAAAGPRVDKGHLKNYT
jgi:hypothetical protein